MAEFRSEFVDAAGIKTHYLTAGSGPLLVLVHGGGAGADAWGNWKGCIPLYAPHFKVIAVDMVGFGKSEKPDPAGYTYSQSNRNKHLSAFIRALGAGAVNLIGNSMGGATSLGVAMERPDLVNKLVLMGSAGLDVANPDPSAKKALGAYDFTPEGMRKIMLGLTGSRYQMDEELLHYRHKLTLEPDARRALAAINKANAAEGLTYPEEAIRTVKTPTLVVGGKEDKIAILARNYRFLELLENSWGFILPHCGHWVMIESPKEFVSVTSAFFQSDMFTARP